MSALARSPVALLLWVLVLGVLVGAGGSFAWVLRAQGGGAAPVRDANAASPAVLSSAAPEVLTLAGSGSNIPITRILVRAHCAALGREHDCPVLVHESIGSGGAIRAVHAGVVDVGLISRPPQDDERALGLVVEPYARTEIVLALHLPAQVDANFGLPDYTSLLGGEQPKAVGGVRLVPLLREQGDSTHQLVADADARFGAANDAALRRGTFRVLYSDRDMCDALRTTVGAVGLVDEGLARTEALSVRLHRLGHRGRPAPTKPLSFVLRADRAERAAAFLRFVRSEAGAAVLRAHGYEPLARAVP